VDPELKFRAPAPERFDRLKTKNRCICLYKSLAPQTVCWTGTQTSGSGSTTKRFWLRPSQIAWAPDSGSGSTALLLVQSLLPFLRHISHGSTIGCSTGFIFGHKRFVWWLHIAELTVQTVKKTCNCRYKQTKDSAGTDKKRRYRRSDDTAELKCT